jgi:tripartite-type tricarboxylate transporter receptor subunit TctC
MMAGNASARCCGIHLPVQRKHAGMLANSLRVSAVLRTFGIVGGVAMALVIASAVSVSRANEVADFYRGKTVTLTAGFNPGGGADTYARTIARHIGRHIPGTPSVVVKNMQGASSVIAANHIFNIAARDGTDIGLFAGNIVIDPLINDSRPKYDPCGFNWIGAPSSAPNICLSPAASSFKSIKDVLEREMVVGTTGTAGNSTFDFPTILNSVLGTKFRLVKGYAGSAALNLAMSRGEIEGFCGVSYDFLHVTGLTGKVNILIQLGLSKSPSMPDVPFVMDYAANEESRQIFDLVFGWLDFERMIGAPPGIPADRLAALRAAFEHTMKDSEFLADAARTQITISPMSGEDILRFIEQAYRIPTPILEKAATYLGRQRP